MSKEIEERVVSMEFDNKRFEKNVSTTMSTLDKLKQKLHLDGASKGLENVDKASKKVDMKGLAGGVEEVRSRFSALEVMGVTALANITNSAVNAGKRMISALTIDPIKTGFQEYETQMNAVQTILANTKSKGSTLDDVNNALDTLNEYADKTIYNFTEMTRNIGTFTAAGVDLQTSVDSIQGIANLAAVSGSSSQQASTAMYQLSQALAAGKVSLMDWNSVVNAGMGGELFQNALIRTSELLKTGAKDAIAAHGSFRESLTKGEWLTTEVLTETLKQLSGAYTEADLMAQGFTKEQAKEITSLAQTASDAATKVKTFSQLWDVMKESAQSGWSQTWKLIIGDFEQAKALLTPLADFFTGAIGKMSDARNKLLESALGKGLTKSFESVKNVLNDVKKPIDTITNALGDLGKMADRVILGEFGNGRARLNALTEAGYNYYAIQNKVNEQLGCSFRYTEEQIAAQDKLLGTQTKVNEKTGEQTGETVELTDANKKLLKTLVNMTDTQLEAAGYTKEQIEAIRELRAQAEKLGIPLNDFIDNLDQINGRWLLWDSFKNIGKSLVTIFKSIGNAFRTIFKPITGDQLFNVIAGFHKLSSKLVMSEENADKLERTFRGLFAVIDIITTVLGGGCKIAFKLVSQFLSAFNLNILDVTAYIGDLLLKMRNFINRSLDFTWVFERMVPIIKKAGENFKALKEWIVGIKDAENIPEYIAQGFMNGLGRIVNFFKTWFKQVKTNITEGFNGIPGDIISGFNNGIWEGMKAVGQTMLEFGEMIIQKVKDVLGIHSPSTVFFAIGGFIIAGLLAGLSAAFPQVREFFINMWGNITDTFNDIDFGKIIAGAGAIGMTAGIVKIGGFFEALASPLEGLGEIFEGTGEVLSGVGKVLSKSARSIKKILNATSKVVKSFAKVMNAVALKIGASALKDIAIAVLMLVGAIAVLTLLDPKRLIGATAAIATILTAIGLLMKEITNMGKDAEIKLAKFAALIMSVSGALMLIAIAAKVFAGISWGDLGKTGAALGGMLVIFGALILLGQAVSKDIKSVAAVAKLGPTLMKIGGAMLMLAMVAKIMAGMSWDEMGRAGAGIGGLMIVIAGLIFATKLAGKDIDKVGATIGKIGAAMLLLAITAKLISGMTWDEMLKAGVGIVALGGIVTGLIAATKLAGKDINKVGGTIAAIGGAMLMLAVTAKIMGTMSWEALGKATVGMVLLGGIVTGLIAATKLAGGNSLKGVATTILMVSVSIGILAGVSALLGLLSLEHLAKGIIAVGLLSGMVALMIHATKGAEDVKGNIIALTVAIGVMAAAVALLSLIDPAKLAIATTSIGVLMGMFALMEKAATGMKSGMGNLIVLTVAVGILAGAIYLISTLPIEAALAASGSLSVLMLSMAASMAIISKLGVMGPMALISVGVMTLVMGALALILYLLADLPVESTKTIAVSLSGMLLAMSAALGILTIIGLGGPAAIIGVLSLMGLITAIGGLIVGIGALVTKFPQLETFLDTGIPILEKIGYALGSFFGNIVNGFAVGATSGLPAIGAALSGFMVGATPFIAGVKMVDGSVLAGVGILSAAIIALTAADFISGIASFLQGGSSFATLGTELSAFITNAMPFILASRLIDPAIMEGVRTLAETILLLTGANLVDGLTSWFAGETSLAAFGAELAAFGPYMAQYAASVAGIDAETVVASANAAKALSEMAANLPNSGGVVGWFAGENDMDTFGSQLVKFGTSLKEYSVSVDGVNVEAITASVTAAKALSGMAADLPNTGGVVSWFTGDNDMGTFGSQLEKFGESLKAYSLSVVGIDTEAVSTSVTAASELSKMAGDIENVGGVVSWFAGDNDLETFGKNLESFGKSISAYSESVAGIDTAAIATSVSAARSLSEIEGALNNSGGVASWFAGDNNLKTFGKNITKFGGYMSDYSAEVAGIDLASLSKSTKAFKSLADMASGLSDINFDGLSSFGKSLGKVGKDGADKFIDAFDNANDDAKKAGSEMVGKTIDGVESKASKLSKAFTKAVDKAVEAIRDKQQRFYNAGSYLVSGLSKGISENDYKVEAKARAMAKAAAEAAEDELDINSPSKVFRKIGSSVPEGFAMGIGMMKSAITSSSTSMANEAVNNVKHSLANIKNLIDTDIDTQPTIRPILDLSDIKSGASTIGSMIGGDSLIGVSANVGAINSMMKQRSQNGANDDVVYALNKLDKHLDKVGNTTYSIGGITYDDGTNVSEAVRTLVRAVKVERRT